MVSFSARDTLSLHWCYLKWMNLLLFQIFVWRSVKIVHTQVKGWDWPICNCASLNQKQWSVVCNIRAPLPDLKYQFHCPWSLRETFFAAFFLFYWQRIECCIAVEILMILNECSNTETLTKYFTLIFKKKTKTKRGKSTVNNLAYV